MLFSDGVFKHLRFGRYQRHISLGAPDSYTFHSKYVQACTVTRVYYFHTFYKSRVPLVYRLSDHRYRRHYWYRRHFLYHRHRYRYHFLCTFYGSHRHMSRARYLVYSHIRDALLQNNSLGMFRSRMTMYLHSRCILFWPS